MRGSLPSILLRRCAQAVSVAVFVSVLCFFMVRQLPGDLAYRIAAGRYGYDLVDTRSADAVRAELGLDRPVLTQLGDWLLSLAQFDLGRSLVTSRPVTTEIGYYLLGTLQLTLVALALAIALGVTVGVLAARHPGSVVDRITDVWVAAVRALPPFLLGLLLVTIFSVQFGLLPAVGHGSATSLVLPAATLAVGLSGLFARVTRDAVVEVQTSEYVQFARTKGLSDRVILIRHVARNAGVLVVPYIGAQALILIEGVVVVESLFGWQGLGHALVHAVFWRDVPMLQATALTLALIVVTINTVVDVIMSRLDPRPRREAVTA